MAKHTVTLMYHFSTYRTVTADIEAQDEKSAAAVLRGMVAADQIALQPSDSEDITGIDFEVSAPAIGTVSWRENF